MNRYKSKTETFGEDYNKDTSAEREEACNAYYTRKQRTKANKLAPDCEAEIAGPDTNAEYDNFKDSLDKGPMNTPWARDRYGRS